MKIWDRLYVYKAYASRAYVSLIGWIVTMGTFAMVLYDNLMLLIPGLVMIFPNAFVFMFVSIPFGLVFLAFLGRWDWKKGTFPREAALSFQNNPEWNILMKDIQHIKRHLVNIDGEINDIFGILEDY